MSGWYLRGCFKAVSNSLSCYTDRRQGNQLWLRDAPHTRHSAHLHRCSSSLESGTAPAPPWNFCLRVPEVHQQEIIKKKIFSTCRIVRICLALSPASHPSKIQQSLLCLLLSRFCKTETCGVSSSFDTESTLWDSPSGSVLQMKNGIHHKPDHDGVILHCFPIMALSCRQLGLLTLNSGAVLLQAGSAGQCPPTAKTISTSAGAQQPPVSVCHGSGSGQTQQDVGQPLASREMLWGHGSPRQGGTF